MKNFLTNFPFKKISIFITVIVSFTYNVLLEKNLECTCNYVFQECFVYMSLPSFIFFLLILWTDKEFKGSFKYRCFKYRCLCCNKSETQGAAQEAAQGRDEAKKEKETCCRVSKIISIRIIKAFLVGVLWVVSVLIDGDWNVCCKPSLSVNETQLACKAKSTITAEEQLTINGLRNESRMIGFIILLFIIGLVVLMSAWDRRGCCCCCDCSGSCQSCENWKYSGNCDCSGCSGCCDERVVYDELILKESENVKVEVLRERTKDRLKNNFEKKLKELKKDDKDEDFKEYFNVVDEMIRNPVHIELGEDPLTTSTHYVFRGEAQIDQSPPQQEQHDVQDPPSSGQQSNAEPAQRNQEEKDSKKYTVVITGDANVSSNNL